MNAHQRRIWRRAICRNIRSLIARTRRRGKTPSTEEVLRALECTSKSGSQPPQVQDTEIT